MGDTVTEFAHPDAIRAAADALMDAAETGVATESLVARWPELTVTDAYTVQLLRVERRRAAGRRIRGHKVGLTLVIDAAIQLAAGVGSAR